MAAARRRKRDWEAEAIKREDRRLRSPCAYRLHVRDEHTVVPVLINHLGGEFEASACVCVQQAITSATRWGTMALEYRGISGWLPGRAPGIGPLTFADLPLCTVTDPSHVDCHVTALPEEP